LLEATSKQARAAGGDVEIVAIPGQPALVKLLGLVPEQASEALEGVLDPHGRQVAVTVDAAAQLARFASTRGNVFGVLRPATLGWSGGVQQFDVRRGRWRSVERPSEPGAYRLAQGATWYLFRAESGATFSGPHELVKIAAARAAGVSLHAYDEAGREFVSRRGCEPPGLLGRALVACSGELPTPGHGVSHFKRVPPAIAATVLHALYHGELPK
jgi:hypothetical protein